MPLSWTSLDNIFCLNKTVTHFVLPSLFTLFSFFPSSNTAPMPDRPRQATLSPVVNCDHQHAALPRSQCHVSKFISWQLHSETIRFSTENKSLLRQQHVSTSTVWDESLCLEWLFYLWSLENLNKYFGSCSPDWGLFGIFLKSHRACLPPHPTDLCCLSAMACQPSFRLHGLSLSSCFNELATACYKSICYKTIITAHPSGIHFSIELLLLNLEFLVQTFRKILRFLRGNSSAVNSHSPQQNRGY